MEKFIFDNFEKFNWKVSRFLNRSQFGNYKTYIVVINIENIEEIPESKKFEIDTVIANSFRPTDTIFKAAGDLYIAAINTNSVVSVSIIENRIKRRLENLMEDKLKVIIGWALAPFESQDFLSLLKLAYNKILENKRSKENVKNSSEIFYNSFPYERISSTIQN
ncbi:GGDEF domain-containing protein, diguanylate cyclase (c-di-GMP synthetase) or its enzymatically inactive variants [Balnearium lithotrophicum]|uniref:GGDEF domain-containing protein, diguanylate cyclase (C-di-GMP synthetase) or its enzymatically inactive variants n=1 Tax=Balnearium lithotrophicum TaxID=223788 RepID=A0A521CFE8_9BACT|nr:hypothetical protein [Balnearium lithotrophicum]SMO57480.1 GGDEF domain-containing protein, diguanylate cyclase (c-di-GMP synthetase) or its enzymatically inactive variants [Balnearium lithotrophicum]